MNEEGDGLWPKSRMSKDELQDLYAELDRDNEMRRAYREQGLEPPTTWATRPPPLPPPPETTWGRIKRRYREITDAVGRFIDGLIMLALYGAGMVALAFVVWWLASPILTNEHYRQILVAAIIGGLVVKYVL